MNNNHNKYSHVGDLLHSCARDRFVRLDYPCLLKHLDMFKSLLSQCTTLAKFKTIYANLWQLKWRDWPALALGRYITCTYKLLVCYYQKCIYTGTALTIRRIENMIWQTVAAKINY